MRKVIEECLKKNKDIHELIEYVNSSKKKEKHIYKDYTETKEKDSYAITVEENIFAEKNNKITDIYLLKINETFTINKVSLRKFSQHNKKISCVEYHFELSEKNENDFSVIINFRIFSDSVLLRINQDFQIIDYSKVTYYKDSKQLNDFFLVLNNLNNTIINKAYLELFLFNKAIKPEIKDLVMLQTDLDINKFVIFEEFGYDFRQDKLNHDIIPIHNKINQKTPKNLCERLLKNF